MMRRSELMMVARIDYWREASFFFFIYIEIDNCLAKFSIWLGREP